MKISNTKHITKRGTVKKNPKKVELLINVIDSNTHSENSRDKLVEEYKKKRYYIYEAEDAGDYDWYIIVLSRPLNSLSSGEIKMLENSEGIFIGDAEDWGQI